MSFAVVNFVTLQLFLFLFCISFPLSGSQIETVLNSLRPFEYLNGCADIRCLRIFEHYKYLNADWQKGIQII